MTSTKLDTFHSYTLLNFILGNNYTCKKMFTCIAKCICRCRKSRTGYATTTIYAEKGHGHFRDEPTKNCADTINEVLGVLLTATAAPDNATRALEEIVRDSGWWDAWTAKALLSAIEDLLRSGKEMASTMEAAVDRAVCEAAKIPELAKQFAEEHPLMVGIVCAIVALGVLYIFWPAVLELLGFGSDGPIEGTKALTALLHPTVTAQQLAEPRDLRHMGNACTADTQERGDMREDTKIQSEYGEQSTSFEVNHGVAVLLKSSRTDATTKPRDSLLLQSHHTWPTQLRRSAMSHVSRSPNRTGSSLPRSEHRQSDTLPNGVTQHADTQTASPTVALSLR